MPTIRQIHKLLFQTSSNNMQKQKERFLKAIIEELVGYPSNYSHPKLSQFEIEYSGLDNEVMSIYKKLGGTQYEYPINYTWDIKYPDFCIELDEQLHFNRYRLTTLESEIYSNYKYFSIDNYKSYCQLYEDKCLASGKYGHKWKSKSSEKFFLNSSPDGIIEGNGSSRWRQRAFNDFLKDINSIIRNKPIIRIAIYDEYKNETIKSILNREDKYKTKEFIQHLLDTI